MESSELDSIKNLLKLFIEKEYPKKSTAFIRNIQDININNKTKKILLYVNSLYGIERINSVLDIINLFFTKQNNTNYEITIKNTSQSNNTDIIKNNTISKKNEKTKKDISNLNPKFTFESFIVGENSKFAYNLCLNISKKPAFNYNPCLIYGDVGLGKTHLVQALGNEIVKKLNLKVLYTPCEKFIDDYILSIQKNKATEYKNLFKNVDVLIIDDIHLLEDKEGTQEALFNIFNSLKDANKQLVFTCDRPLAAIKLQERLLSRLGSGIFADLKAPDYDTRMAIINKKCQEINLDLKKDIRDFIAKNVVTNVRNIEACITTLYGCADLIGNNINNISTVKEILSDVIIIKDNTDDISDSVIIDTVAEYFNVLPRDIRGNKRTKSLVIPRNYSIYLINQLTNMSTTEIGMCLGGRDHSTIIYAINKVKEQLNQEKDDSLKKILNIITDNIKKKL